MKKWALTAGLLFAVGCVPKKDYLKLEDDLQASRTELEKTKKSLEEMEALKPQLDALKPELEAKNAALQSAKEELERVKVRLAQLDKAQKEMEDSLRNEIDQKSIKIEKLKDSLTVTFIDKILFDSGSAAIKDAGKTALKKVADSLSRLSGNTIRVEGHTDNVPLGAEARRKFPTNWELSTARATAVVRFLQEAGNLDPLHLYAVGGAFYHPVADNDTPEGRAQNRRVEIVLSPLSPSDGKK